MAAKRGFGLNFKDNKLMCQTVTPACVFNQDSEDEEIANEKDVNVKFHMKYGSNKSKDERAVAHVLAEDPDAFEYDSVYDDIQAQRNLKSEAQIKADKERKPKYAQQFALSHKKREMERLMIEERKQQKEREAEGDEFADKETYVTSAYREQIELREQARRELEAEDRASDRLKVEDQEFWQASFQRKRLEDISRTTELPKKVKEEPVDAEVKPTIEKPKKTLYFSSSESEPETAEPESKHFGELKAGLNLPKVTKTEPSAKDDRSSSNGRRERDSRHRRRGSSSPRRRRSRSHSNSQESQASQHNDADPQEHEDDESKTAEQIRKEIERNEMKAHAQILEMMGDLHHAEEKPPENVLFVCKLNPVTTSEDLKIIFSRFGTISDCEVIKDRRTQQSLQYAFIEFETPEQCEAAYLKMDNVLIDDRRIHVDFSQSVAKNFQWKRKAKKSSPPPRKQHRKRSSPSSAGRQRKSRSRERGATSHRHRDHRERRRHRSRSRSPHRSHRRRDRSPDDRHHRDRSPDDRHRRNRHRSRSPDRDSRRKHRR